MTEENENRCFSRGSESTQTKHDHESWALLLGYGEEHALGPFRPLERLI